MVRIEIVFSRGDDMGGVQRFSIMLGEQLEKRGYDVVLVFGGIENKIATVTNLKCIFLRDLSRYSFLGFHKYLNKKDPNCVRILGSTAVGLGGVLSSRNSIFVFHGLASNYSNSYRKLLLRIVEKIIAFSYRNRVFLKYSDCEQLGFRDSNVIPNYVDSEKFVPSFDRDVDALVVSRHSQQKMIKKMIDFCVGEKFERVIILGDGPDFQENVAYAEERILGASTKFTFIKYDARPERYFSRAKYYVHFAVSEGMPLAVLEAMASGCIVVLNRFQGAEELIRHSHTGYIVDSVSSTSLPAYDQDVGSRAREVVIESYSVDAFADAYENLISRMIAH